METKKELTQEYVRELLDYNPETGELTRRVDRGKKHKAGDPAGYVTKRGQLRLAIDGKYYIAKRIIWLYEYGILPTTRVKSKDGDGLNLRVSNLELTNAKTTLCNKPRPQLSKEEVRALFYYTDGKLFWGANKGSRIKIGDEAGGIDRSGYAKVNVNRVCYRVHRLIWNYFYGAIPDGLSVDHIDTDKLNNRIENLRLVTQRQQQQNTGARQDNTSGFRGVFWNKREEKWRAQIKNNGKSVHLGCFDSKEDATAAYWQASKELHEHRRAA
jgi:hypothetical protein